MEKPERTFWPTQYIKTGYIWIIEIKNKTNKNELVIYHNYGKTTIFLIIEGTREW